MQIKCGHCGKVIKVDETRSDRVVTCQYCGRDIRVPRPDDDVPETPHGESVEEEGFAAKAISAMARKVHVVCGSCGKALSVSARRAGKKAICPACDTRILIPYPDEEDLHVHVRTPPGEEETDEIEILDDRARSDEIALVAAAVKDAEEHPSPPEDAPNGQMRLAGIVRVVFWTALILAGAGASIVLAVWIGRSPPNEQETREAQAGPAARRVSTQSDSRPSPRRGPVTSAPIQPRPVAPACKILADETDVFACDGYFPARPGWVYRKVTANISAGGEPLSFNTFGRDVFLVFGRRRFASLGQPGAASATSALPVRSRRTRVDFRAGESRQITFLFETPRTVRTGRLGVRGLPQAEIVFDAPDDPPTEDLAGTYAEIPPRNLRPLLRDPVMAAIQDAGQARLIVRVSDDAFDLSIPAASVTGRATSLGGGIYLADLTCGDHPLRCKLRLVSGGQERLILYLSDKPFHQLTYARQ